MLKTNEITYVSLDMEATGHIPGLFSMISLGAAAFDEQGRLLEKFLVNLKELEGSKQDPDTMRFWQENPIAYLKTKENPQEPKLAMDQFHDWFQKFEHPVFVFMPQKFDGTFVYWYLQTFVEGMNFLTSPDAIDVKTMAMVALNRNTPASKKFWKKSWKDAKHKHSHLADDDAWEQGVQFFKIWAYLKELHHKAWKYDDLNR
jgi:hypothetical protein